MFPFQHSYNRRNNPENLQAWEILCFHTWISSNDFHPLHKLVHHKYSLNQPVVLLQDLENYSCKIIESNVSIMFTHIHVNIVFTRNWGKETWVMMREGANITGNFILIVYESKDVTLRSMSIAKWSTFNVGLDSKCHSFVHELLPVICHQFESPWIVELVIMYLKLPFTIVIYSLWLTCITYDHLQQDKLNTQKRRPILQNSCLRL